MEHADVAVVGAGAAGLMAAGSAAMCGARVVLLDKNPGNGRKLLITGKGRCNLTNACDMADFVKNVPDNGRFLYGAFARFTNEDLLALLGQYGLTTKVERGGRVFPTSDRAADVLAALERFTFVTGQVTRVTGCVASLVLSEGRVCGVRLTDGRTVGAYSVIVATGGASYPQTGSSGDGYRLAAQAGHTVVPPRPALVPLETAESWPQEAMGLSLRNIGLRVTDETGRTVYTDFGELMLTHYGVSGPVVISASSHLTDMDAHTYRLWMDLKPALDEGTLDKRVVRDFSENQNRDFANSLSGLFPKKLIPVMVRLSGIPPHTKVHDITREQRTGLVRLMKALPLTVTRTRPIAEAIVTSGGVAVDEVDPKSMASRRCAGLYFAGEVLDVAGYTGGFNLQIAFSTGWCAGEHAGAAAFDA